MIQTLRRQLPAESGYSLVYSWQDEEWLMVWLDIDSDHRQGKGQYPPVMIRPHKYGPFVTLTGWCCGGINPWSIHWTDDSEDLRADAEITPYDAIKPEYI